MISCPFCLNKVHPRAVGWMVDTLSPRERLCTLAAVLSSQRTVTVDAIVEAAATLRLMYEFFLLNVEFVCTNRW